MLRPLVRFTRIPTGRRWGSTLAVIEPSSTAARQAPTPVLLLAASGWDPPHKFERFISLLSSRGYQSLLLTLTPSAGQTLDSITEEASTALRNAPGGMPFPPALIARGYASLVAQNYASSHPLSALQLIDPPLSAQAVPKHILENVQEFDFEPRFPCRVVWSTQELERQQREGVPWYEVHRIENEREEEAGESLDRYTFDDEQQAEEETLAWLEDECGLADEPHPPPSHEMPAWFTEASYTLQPGRKQPLTLDESHLSETFVRGSGPGGQAINKLSTNVQLVHLPTGTRLTCQDTRSRSQNRVLARRRMAQMLEHLLLPRRSRISAQHAKARKKKANKKKKQRKRMSIREEEAKAAA